MLLIKHKIFLISVIAWTTASAIATSPINTCNMNQTKIIPDTLRPCPNTPNCVNTADPNPKKHMKPLTYTDGFAEAKKRLKNLIDGLPRTKLITEKEGYLHYEFVTPIGRFTDDVEFLFDEQTKQIHFRSASRIGYSDFWANRRRMKRISRKWKALQKMVEG